MNRSDLVYEVADKTGLTVTDCDQVIRAFIESMTSYIARGEKITLSGFGTFERKTRRATNIRNPHTRELMSVEEQNVAVFRAGAALKDAVRFERW